MRYITTFADFYRESKSILKTKDDPTYCPPSCRISIPLQPMQRVKESTAFKTLADESARIANDISLRMAAQVLKCKYLNNADKQRESIEIYAKGLANMAEIIIAEINTDSMTKHDLVTDFLSFHEHDALSHLTITVGKFIEIYRQTNKLRTPLRLHQTPHSPDPPRPHADDMPDTADMTPPTTHAGSKQHLPNNTTQRRYTKPQQNYHNDNSPPKRLRHSTLTTHYPKPSCHNQPNCPPNHQPTCPPKHHHTYPFPITNQQPHLLPTEYRIHRRGVRTGTSLPHHITTN